VPLTRPAQRGRARRASLPAVALALALGTVGAACGKASPATTTTVPPHTTSTLPPLPPEIIAYVSLAGTGAALGSGDVVLPIDLTSGTGVTKPGITVGMYPDAIAISPNRTMAYVANYASNSVTPIDLQTGVALEAIPAGSGPAAIAIAPDGRTAYVTDDGSGGALGDTVTPIDLVTRKPLAAIKVGLGPQGIAISPDGTTALVTDAGAIPSLGQAGPPGKTVTPIDLTTGKAGNPIAVGNGPLAVAITPGGEAYVANLDSQSVTPIDVATGVPSAPIAVPGGPVALLATAQTVYVVDAPSSTSPGNNVSPISVATGTTGRPIAVPKGAQYIALVPGESTAWVTCLDAGVIAPINLATGQVGRSIPVAGGPFAIAITLVPQVQPGATPTTVAKSKTKKK
jgi:hyaluronoglucosaminidase